MKRAGIVAAFFALSVILHAQTPATLPLVQPGDLVLQYSFRVPDDFAYGGTPLAFNPAHNSLFLVNKVGGAQEVTANRIAEISIPATGTLPMATFLQPLADVMEGKLPLVNPGDANDKYIGGLLPWLGRLIISGYAYFDASGSQVLSHFASGLTLATTGDLVGPFQVGTEKAGFVSGYMGVVPAAWRTALGGPAFTGQCCLAINFRTSSGPAVFTFDPVDVGVKNPVPAQRLLFYDNLHPLGPYGGASPYYNGATQITGVVMPEGTRSVLFFGRHGTATASCYGPGTANPALVGTIPAGFVDPYCYDPEDLNKGPHSYPYAYYVWAYDANDLVAVKNGLKQPWEPRPYAVWPLTFPTKSGMTKLTGAAYDPATGRLFLGQYKGDGDKPLIHVFTIGSGSGPVIVTPPPPPPVLTCSDPTATNNGGPLPCVYPTPPPPPPPPVIVHTASMTVKTCTLVVGPETPPAGYENGSVQFYRNGIAHGTVDATAPYTKAATVNAGAYRLTAKWMKTGMPTLTVDLGTRTCGVP